MVRQEFTDKASVEYNGPEQQEPTLALGNAFVGAVGAAAGAVVTEITHAFQNAASQGDGYNSSLNIVSMRMQGQSSEEGSKKRDGRGGAQSFYNALMRQQLLDMAQTLGDWARDLRQHQRDIEHQITALDELRYLVANGLYDPDNAEHQALFLEANPGADASDREEFDGMTMSEQLNTIDDTRSEAQIAHAEIGERIVQINDAIDVLETARESGDPIPMTEDGRFLNPILEQARENAGLVIGDVGLNEESLRTIGFELRSMRAESLAESLHIEDDPDSGVKAEAEQNIVATNMAATIVFNS